MWYRYIVLIFTIASIYVLPQAQSEIFQLADKRSSGNKYCGPVLSNMLEIVCKGIYNMQIYKKSTYDSSDEDYDYEQQAYLEDARLPFPYRSRSHAASMNFGRFRRHTTGIVDECCKKSCTISELKTYCGH